MRKHEYMVKTVETWGWYDLAHVLRDGTAVVIRFRHSDDAVYSFNWQNHEPWGLPGCRAVTLFRSPDELIVQKVIGDQVESLYYLLMINLTHD